MGDSSQSRSAPSRAASTASVSATSTRRTRGRALGLTDRERGERGVVRGIGRDDGAAVGEQGERRGDGRHPRRQHERVAALEVAERGLEGRPGRVARSGRRPRRRRRGRSSSAPAGRRPGRRRRPVRGRARRRGWRGRAGRHPVRWVSRSRASGYAVTSTGCRRVRSRTGHRAGPGQQIESRAMSTDESRPAPTHDGDAPARTRVALVFGGRSSEHAVSCATAASVLEALDRDRYDVVPVGIAKDGHWVLAPDDPQALRLAPGHVPEVDTDGRERHRADQRHRPDPRGARGRPAAAHARRGRRRLPAAARAVRRGRHDPGAARPRRREVRRVRASRHPR